MRWGELTLDSCTAFTSPKVKVVGKNSSPLEREIRSEDCSSWCGQLENRTKTLLGCSSLQGQEWSWGLQVFGSFNVLGASKWMSMLQAQSVSAVGLLGPGTLKVGTDSRPWYPRSAGPENAESPCKHPQTTIK